MNKLTVIITAATLVLGTTAGTIAYAHKDKGKGEGRFERMVERVTEKLELDVTQQQALENLKNEFIGQRMQVKEQMSDAREEMLQMVTAADFDEARALELVNQRALAIQAGAPDVVNAMGLFLDTLNTEQKAEVQQMIEKFKDHRKNRRKAQ